MESIDHFKQKLCEIDTLIVYAEDNQSNIAKYQLFNKVAIVLLSTKFEVFLEDFMEEHSLRILAGHTNLTFPDELREIYATTAAESIVNEKKKDKKIQYFNSIATLYSNNETQINNLSLIRPSLKFNYGKHGQKEIEKLFSRHGLTSFIDKEPSINNLLMQINSLIEIRNNVIHQDSSPTITHQTINEHKENLLRFAESLEAHIERNKSIYYNE